MPGHAQADPKDRIGSQIGMYDLLQSSFSFNSLLFFYNLFQQIYGLVLTEDLSNLPNGQTAVQKTDMENSETTLSTIIRTAHSLNP